MAGGNCKVVWQVVCSPRDLGGLGLPDLPVLGFALRLRWEWMRRTEPESPWASLPVREERMVQRMFRASVKLVVGNGASVRFWTDDWLPAGPIYWLPGDVHARLGMPLPTTSGPGTRRARLRRSSSPSTWRSGTW